MKRNRGTALQLTLSPDKSTTGAHLTETISSIVLALLLYFGLGGLVVSLFNLPVLGVVPAVLGILIVVFAFALCHTTKSRLLGVAMLIICIIILWILAAKYARAGLSLTINSLSTVVDIEFLRINAQYTVDVSPTIYLACGTLFLTPLAVPLALACIFIVRKSLGWVGVIILVPFVVVGMFESVRHTGIWSALLFVGVALLLCRCLAATQGAKNSASVMLSMGAVLLAACLIGSGIVLLAPGNIPAKTAYLLERNQLNILMNIHRMRYETDTYTVLPEGDFASITAPTFSYEKVLKLVISAPESIYLRGYIGEVYTNFGWTSIDKKVMNTYTGLFYQLHKNNFYPQTQLANLADILDDTLSQDDALTFKVENTAACRGYIYAPYEVLKADDMLLPADNLLESRLISDGFLGTADYQLTVLPNQVKRFQTLAEMLAQQSSNPSEALRHYLEQESRYRNFVYEQYTSMPPEDSALLTAYIGEPGIAGQTHVAYEDAKNNILAMMAKQLEYSDKNAAFSGDGSYIRHIMRKNQSASTVGYASVAVMMLRHYGIPARYVEGYIITPDDAEAVGDDSNVDILDYNAHAWAEYYHDGVGWIPFEANPNYLGVMEGITAPPSAGQSNQGGAQPEPEDIPPEHDRHRDEDAGFLDKFLNVLRLLLPLLLTLAALVGLIGAWLYYRLKTIDKRKKAWEESENNAAVCSMMAYILVLLGAIGLKELTHSPRILASQVAEQLGETIGDEYERAVDIFLQAAFSHHTVSQSDREAVYALLQHIIVWLEQSQSRQNRLIMRYVKCLY
ncbi:MAG: transglutaminase-like domain-containing protein [Candidatus Fimivivens sp.]